MKQRNTFTPMIKAKALNAIVPFFFSKRTYNEKTHRYEQLNPLFELSNDEKISRIEPIMKQLFEELKGYKEKRKTRADIAEDRLIRGYYESKALKRATRKAKIKAAKKNKIA